MTARACRREAQPGPATGVRCYGVSRAGAPPAAVGMTRLDDGERAPPGPGSAQPGPRRRQCGKF